MLILTRRVGEKLQIGDNISITVIQKRDDEIQLGITAPHDVVVRRRESRLTQSRNSAQTPTEESDRSGRHR